jgi:hypothetical protein
MGNAFIEGIVVSPLTTEKSVEEPTLPEMKSLLTLKSPEKDSLAPSRKKFDAAVFMPFEVKPTEITLVEPAAAVFLITMNFDT